MSQITFCAGCRLLHRPPLHENRGQSGYRHGEAFCLMTYASKDRKIVELVWNSRDGVTPFSIAPRGFRGPGTFDDIGPPHAPPGGGPAHRGLRRRSGNKARVLGVQAGRPADSAGAHRGTGIPREDDGQGRNRRSVWTISTKPFAGAHFAVMPWDLVEPCVLAGSRPGDPVLDPFAGTGTVGMVARRHGRHFIGIELNPAYVEMARRRITADAPLLNTARTT